MNIDTVLQQLHEMRLPRMPEQLQERLSNGDHNDLSHEEFIALLVEDEYLRESKNALIV